MPSDGFPEKRFATSEELLQHLKERCDDAELVNVSVANGTVLNGPGGEQKYVPHAGAVVRLVNGDSLLIHRDDLQDALNDGVFNRLRIPIRLVPLLAEEEGDYEMDPRD